GTGSESNVDRAAGSESSVDRAAESGSGVDYAAEARGLLDWLIDNRCTGYHGFCGSHQHEIQTLSVKGDTNTPSVVSTAYPARALLRAADLDPVYPAVGRTAAEFVVEDLAYREVDEGATIRYLPTDTEEYYTPNAMALGARLLVDLYAYGGREDLASRAGKILDFVADLQTDRGGWMYRHPPDASHLSMDNFHNGFIVEAMLRYSEVVDGARYDDVLDRALEFYRGVLFSDDGAPNWDETDSYPRDIHAAAQGILVFTYAGEYERASRIVSWTLDNLYAGDGRFFYRKQRFYTRRITLMRWCQAWMSYALSEYLTAVASR
ncbi:MAG: antibiotic ABC transporter permease, partial [Salinigranum sp.]